MYSLSHVFNISNREGQMVSLILGEMGNHLMISRVRRECFCSLAKGVAMSNCCQVREEANLNIDVVFITNRYNRFIPTPTYRYRYIQLYVQLLHQRRKVLCDRHSSGVHYSNLDPYSIALNYAFTLVSILSW